MQPWVAMLFRLSSLWITLLLFNATSSSRAESQTPFSVPPADGPELARRGEFHVGVRTIQISHPNQPDILHFDKQTGKAPLYDRPLTLEVWYPAIIPPDQNERTTYTSAVPGPTSSSDPSMPATFEISGKALRDAAPLTSSRFPLVIVSHGYPGSRTFLMYLTENLASKGYVVVAIDHTDSVFGNVLPFPSTLLNRSSDQLFTIQAIRDLSAKSNNFLHQIVDTDNVAVVGYSMGGYGALLTAGAGLSRRSSLLTFVPGGYLDDWTASSPKYQGIDRHAIKAIVAIAPWGEQPPYSAWDAEGLAAIKVPSFFIAGDKDDVADYANGIKPAFEKAISSQRYLLLYANARHNTGGNPPPPGLALNYSLLESFDEPVWRKDRINSINQHFITAFLDLYLKGNEARRAYLHLPISNSNDGVWKIAEGAPGNGAFSTGKDAEGHPFWTGFQRRWALGLELLERQATQ